MQLENRTFIVTGGSSGLGRATAQALAHSGARVALFDLAEPIDAAEEELPSELVRFYPVDISCTTDITKGIMNSSFEPLALAKLQQAINVNLVGSLDLIRQVVPHMAQLPESIDPDDESERGVIVMVSSAAAYDGQQGQVAYAATKGAIRSLTLPLARDLSRYGIRAVSIAPNMFSTPMTAQGKMPERARKAIEAHFEWPKRAGKPEEFGGSVLEIFRNRMLNGCCLRLDGAMRLPGKF
ncbi:uncharacterized protein N7518_001412 [Penicillium psychrosexuale]|uniref:uncharacterized protein n=1 Tax=Penicillium psychrosexuale TaxID=1002107 RepID=UPI002545A7DB|nr:uncharacterized protein N7518_001412 [Penicillium psychrosexuale]KAJ5799344.1 hypothetical protein N7518_001412 [Penicillium psychrosexuale]